MKKLWQKDWQLDSLVEEFETGTDVGLDQALVKSDVVGSLAHVAMLAKVGLMEPPDAAQARKGLLAVLELAEAGGFGLEMGDEDVHSKIENFITEQYGEVGKKIHLGRSRNDQVLTAVRLYTKAQLLELEDAVITLAEGFAEFADEHEFVPMPGYTHMQKAMPSSVGMWAGAMAESLLDDLAMVRMAYALNDQSPLGSAAGYGVPLPLDREYAAGLMGFAKAQNNALYCQNSRGKIEAAVLAGVNAVMFDVGKFATDVLLFSMPEFGYFEVANELRTGSSIMPQKRNVDVAELLRSKVHLVTGLYVQAIGVGSSLMSGYNRDLQDSKQPLMDGLKLGVSSSRVAKLLLAGVTPNAEAMRTALTPEIFATHRALELVRQGKSFREAYQLVGAAPAEAVGDVSERLRNPGPLGSTSNLQLAALRRALAKERQSQLKTSGQFEITMQALLTQKDS